MYRLFQFLTNGQTEELIDYLADSVQKLKNAGADFVVMSGNTPHIVFDKVQQRVQIPMISIVRGNLATCKKGWFTKDGTDWNEVYNGK